MESEDIEQIASPNIYDSEDGSTAVTSDNEQGEPKGSTSDSDPDPTDEDRNGVREILGRLDNPESPSSSSSCDEELEQDERAYQRGPHTPSDNEGESDPEQIDATDNVMETPESPSSSSTVSSDDGELEANRSEGDIEQIDGASPTEGDLVDSPSEEVGTPLSPVATLEDRSDVNEDENDDDEEDDMEVIQQDEGLEGEGEGEGDVEEGEDGEIESDEERKDERSDDEDHDDDADINEEDRTKIENQGGRVDFQRNASSPGESSSAGYQEDEDEPTRDEDELTNDTQSETPESPHQSQTGDNSENEDEQLRNGSVENQAFGAIESVQRSQSPTDEVSATGYSCVGMLAEQTKSVSLDDTSNQAVAETVGEAGEDLQGEVDQNIENTEVRGSDGVLDHQTITEDSPENDNKEGNIADVTSSGKQAQDIKMEREQSNSTNLPKSNYEIDITSKDSQHTAESSQVAANIESNEMQKDPLTMGDTNQSQAAVSTSDQSERAVSARASQSEILDVHHLDDHAVELDYEEDVEDHEKTAKDGKEDAGDEGIYAEDGEDDDDDGELEDVSVETKNTL